MPYTDHIPWVRRINNNKDTESVIDRQGVQDKYRGRNTAS